MGVAVMKNGSFVASKVGAVTLGGNMAVSASVIDIPNGSTDHYEVAGFLATAGAGGTVQAGGATFFCGEQI